MKMTRRSPDERLRKAADCLSRFVLDRTLYRCRLEATTFKLNPNSLFEDGTGPGLEPVGSEFQPSFETVYPGDGAHLIFRITFYFRVNPKLNTERNSTYLSVAAPLIYSGILLSSR